MEKVAIITGGTRGIGLAIAKKFLLEGIKVIAASVDPKETVEAALAEFKELGCAEYQYLNVSDKINCAKLVKYVINKYGRVDILVNAAGVRGKVDSPLNTDFDNLNQTMQINLMGTIQMATIAAGFMKDQNAGVIINVSSISGSMVTAIDYGYHCSKCGVDMATKILAKEVSPYGIRCVSVAPGGVKAGMNSSEWEKEGKKLHIKNRLLRAKEVADAIYLMTTEEASAINGSVLLLDDGYTAFKGVFNTDEGTR